MVDWRIQRRIVDEQVQRAGVLSPRGSRPFGPFSRAFSELVLGTQRTSPGCLKRSERPTLVMPR